MNLFFTGLNGLVGSRLAHLLGHSQFSKSLQISSFIRAPSYASHTIPSRSIASKSYFGSCDSVSDLSAAIQSAKPDLIVHIAQHRYTPNLLSALETYSSTCSLLIVGTTGVFSHFPSCSTQYKYGEQLLTLSGYDFCLVRPSIIYGSKLDKNLHKLFERIRSCKTIILPDGGKSKFQPVYYKDVSFALFLLISKWLENTIFANRFINLTGPDTLTLANICNVIATLSNVSSVRCLNLSIDFCYSATSVLSYLLGDFAPIVPEQILRLREDKVYKSHWHLVDPTFRPTSFEDGIRSMIKSYYPPSF